MTDFLPKPRARGPLTEFEMRRLLDDAYPCPSNLPEYDEVETMRRATTPMLWRAVRSAWVPVVIVVIVAVVLCVVVGAVS